jgi:hypothetical protein
MLRLLHRLYSILLLLSFVLPMAVPAFALAQDDAGLPACCRKGGKHHCAGSMAGMAMSAASQDGPRWKQPVERCPYCPATTVSAHTQVQLAVAAIDTLQLPVGTHPTGVVQTESKWRMSRERSRQKRGPPQFHL